MVAKSFIWVVLALIILPSVLAVDINSSYFWESYGSDFQPLPNAQYPSAVGNFNQTNILVTTMAQGYSPAKGSSLSFFGSDPQLQPMVSTLGSTLGSNPASYLIIPNGNYLQIYNKNLFLQDEIATGANIESQIAMADFNGDNVRNEIVGVYANNSTSLEIKAFSFNSNTLTLSLINQTTINLGTLGSSSIGSTGLRCIAGLNDTERYCYGIFYANNGSNYISAFAKIYRNMSYTLNTLNVYTKAPYLEPLAKDDYDADGTDEFLAWSLDKVAIFSENGNVERSFTSSYSGGTGADEVFRGARFTNPDASSQSRIAVALKTITGCGAGNYNCAYLYMYKADGSTLWSQTFSATNSGDFMDLSNLAIGDYNADGYDDVYLIEKRAVGNQYAKFRVFKGSDGTSFLSETTPFIPATGFTERGENSTIVLARMDGDSSPDIIAMGGAVMTVYSPALDQYIYNNTNMRGFACVPADLNFDSTLQLICTRATDTYLLSTNFTNTNPTLNSFSFSPSLSVQVSSPLSITFNAVDAEGNPILYSGECGNGNNLSEDGSNVKSCTYNVIGTYNFIGRVRDNYHLTYSTGNATITVTQTGAVCNSNAVCEAGLGETVGNCPSDCTSGGGGSPSFESGSGTSLPSELVNADNEDDGLLPSIYFGTLGFWSYVLIPFAVIVFAIFFALTIGVLGKIILNIASGGRR